MSLKVLVAGIEGAGQENLIAQYGAIEVEDMKGDLDFRISEVQIEDEMY